MQNSHYDVMYRYEMDHWWYRVRRELVHDLIQKYYGKSTDLTLADIGCGTGGLIKELEQYGSCTGIDLSPQAVDYCLSRGVKNVHLGSAEDTGCASNSMDVVVCLDVLEHLTDDSLGIKEIKRILKPDGIAIIFVPAFKFLWSVTDVVSHHHRRYRLPQLRMKFRGNDFKILRASYFNTLLFPPIALVRLLIRGFHIPLRSEAETGHGIVNSILYHIFSFEKKLLDRFDLPFGVSIVVVARK